MSLLNALKRRNVFRAGAACVVAAWLINTGARFTLINRKLPMFKAILRPLLLLAILSPAAAALAADDVRFVVAGALIDTLEGKRIANPVVEIEGDRIVAVTGDGVVPDGAKVIDLGDRTLLPGLADMHTHLTYYDTDFGIETLSLSAADYAIRGVVNARRALMAGFTAGRNLGASAFSDVALRNAIDGGHVPGPRLQVSGPSIGATGGHCDNNWLAVDFEAISEGVANGPWAVRQKVRENRKYGADVIKICATGGVLSKGTDPGARQITFDELQAIVDEAHMLGMRVAAHAHGTEGILFAIRAGVDSIEHSSLIDDEGLKLAKRNGTFLSINAYTPVFMREHGESLGIPADSLERARSMADRRLQRYQAAIEAGARIVFGSDTSTYPHGDHAKQFAVYVELGMSPIEAIQSATTVAAESLGWVGDTGAVASGYFADIIAVDGDPLEDIKALEDVAFVMKGGEVYKSP
jgi:imidazolonepropionase-like amidohydrolase